MLFRSHYRQILILAVIVALGAALLLPAGAVSVSDYTDVSEDDWYYDYVSYVVSKGLFLGTSADSFSPDTTMTRGMFVTVLGRFAGVDPDTWAAGTASCALNIRSGPGTQYDAVGSLSSGQSAVITGVSGDWYAVRSGSVTGYVSGAYFSPRYHRFSDVSYDMYYAGYVIWGYEKGIIRGTDSGGAYFAPDSTVTREQICSLMNRYVQTTGVTAEKQDAVTFLDADSISSWAAADVKAMQQYGVVEGEKSGSGYVFNPSNGASRAQTAAMFTRLGKLIGTAATPSPTPTATSQPEAVETATFLSDRISIKSDVIRVGLYVSTRSYATAVSAVTLQAVNGTGFEYGTYDSDRAFVSSGSVSSATVSVTTDGSTFSLKNSSGLVVYTTSGNLALRPVTSGAEGITRVNGENRYHGGFELRQAYYKSGYITVINYVTMDQYVRGVLPWEFGASWPSDTLKAAAIAVRTYAMNDNWTTYSGFGFDVMGNNGSQTYLGRGKSYSESYFSQTDSAAKATSNVYLTYKYNGYNRLCTPFYFSSDGGATEDSGHVFSASYSYLTGKIDPYEAAAKSLASNYTYSITNSRTGSTMTALASRLGLGILAKDGIRIETYSDTGNVKSIKLTDTSGKTATVSQSSSFDRWSFLSAFGFTAYSYNFSVTYNAAADTFTCTRLGWGHNVGMSQWGAYAMAKYYGKNYQQILGFYYDGTHLQYGA